MAATASPPWRFHWCITRRRRSAGNRCPPPYQDGPSFADALGSRKNQRECPAPPTITERQAAPF